MCGAPDQAVALPPGTDLSKETVLTGRVVAGGQFGGLLGRSAHQAPPPWPVPVSIGTPISEPYSVQLPS